MSGAAPAAKVALITGASSGLGLALAKRWRAEGYRIAAISRSLPEHARETVDEFIAADLSKPGEAERAFAEFARSGDRLDALINNAGSGAYAGWEELPEEAWRRLMELDLFTPVALARAALPMLRRTGGVIVNISSVAGLVPVPGMGAYSVAKFGLTAFSESLGAELILSGVRVLTVYPGRIRTGFSSRAVIVRQVPETPGSGASSPDQLARRVWRAARSRKRAVIYPRWYRLFILFTRFFPRTYAKLAVKMWKFQ